MSQGSLFHLYRWALDLYHCSPASWKNSFTFWTGGLENEDSGSSTSTRISAKFIRILILSAGDGTKDDLQSHDNLL